MTAILGTCSSLRILGITRSIHFASKVFSLYSVTTLFWILRQLSRNLQFQTGPTFLSRRHSTKKKLSRRRRSCDAPPTHTFTIQEARGEKKNLLRKCSISEDAISEFFQVTRTTLQFLKFRNYLSRQTYVIFRIIHSLPKRLCWNLRIFIAVGNTRS